MKTCNECGQEYPLSRVLCLDCHEILDDDQYIRFVWQTLLAAFVFHFVLSRFGYTGRGLLAETFMSGFFFLIPCVLTWKVFQKWKEPQRNISYDLASLYSSRFDRLLIVVVTVVGLLITSGQIRYDMSGSPLEFSRYRLVRGYCILIFGLAYLALVLKIQGLSFFDFRLRNALLPRELEHQSTAAPDPS